MTTLERVQFRPAKQMDLIDVLRIERESFDTPWPLGAFEQYLGQPGFIVATLDERVIGYAICDVTSSPIGRIGHLKDLAVHPDVRGNGVGSELLSLVIGQLASEGIDSVRLEVRQTNTDAIELYARFGFSPRRRIIRYYPDGEDALVMVADTHTPVSIDHY